MESFAPLSNLPMLHTTPLASVKCDSPKVIVEADDPNEERIRLTFSPYQAIRMVTIDCFDFDNGISVIPQTIIEVHNSKWISELTSISKDTDAEADFMDKAKHYLLPLQDDVLEVIAWNVTWEKL